MRLRAFVSASLALALSLTLATLATQPSASHAATIFSDGQAHTVNGSSPPIILSNPGTSLTANAGTVIVGEPATGSTLATTAIIAGIGTSLIVNGGTYAGGDAGFLQGGGSAIAVQGAFATINGGIFSGGVAFQPGSALNVGASTTGMTVVNGGTFKGGGGGTGVGGPRSYTVIVSGDTVINGGTFQLSQPVAVNPYVLNFGTTTAAHLDIYGGHFQGNFTLNMLANQPQISDGSVDVYGSGLSLVARRLTGTLSDGSAIDVTVENNANNGSVPVSLLTSTHIRFGIATVTATPEPSSVVLMGLGLAGLAGIGVMGWRRRVAAKSVSG